MDPVVNQAYSPVSSPPGGYTRSSATVPEGGWDDMDNNEYCPALLSHVRGVDPGLARTIPSARLRAVNEEAEKQLALCAELAVPGGGRAFGRWVSQTRERRVGGMGVWVDELSAFLEYGRAWEELSPAERDCARRHEIVQELGHFSRIMGLDEILVRPVPPLTPADAWRRTLDTERFLWLLTERRFLRGVLRERLPQPRVISPSGHWNVTGRTVSMRRARDPAALLVLFCNGGETVEACRELASVGERLLCRGPMEFSLHLLDYYAFLRGLRIRVEIVGFAESLGGDATLLITGHAGVFIVTPDVSRPYRYQPHTRHVMAEESAQLGGLSSARCMRWRIDGGTPGIVFALPPTLCGHSTPWLIGRINAANARGWVHPQNNLRRACEAFSSRYWPVSFSRRAGEASGPSRAAPLNLRSLICEHATLDTLFANARGVIIEAGHVHADRQAGPDQELGFRLGQALAEECRARAPHLSITCVTMVDDDHVCNVLDYRAFLETATRTSFSLDELIFESSPLVKSIAGDMVRVLLQRGMSGRGEVLRRADNLYLLLSGGQEVIELVEGLSGAGRTACILYDAALTFYKRARRPLQRIYASRQPEVGDPHARLLQTYAEVTGSTERLRRAQTAVPPVRLTWEVLHGPCLDMPYWNVGRAAGEGYLVINIIENFYRPQQLKLNRLLAVVGLEPVHTLFFAPGGTQVKWETGIVAGAADTPNGLVALEPPTPRFIVA